MTAISQALWVKLRLPLPESRLADKPLAIGQLRPINQLSAKMRGTQNAPYLP